ncbi:MAG: GNAT family N-acetyltransferase [Chloroflexi bacterium]|nr:GNAT family N-acetyltransferase [Chloroflexota bacterium]
MENHGFTIATDGKLVASELIGLLASVGWGREADYDPQDVERSLAAYPFVAHARDRDGRLVGYVSAFSDGSFSTFIGELVVRPDNQRRGVGTALLKAVEERYPGVPVYAHTFNDTAGFFEKHGYRIAQRPMQVLFKIPVIV